MNRNLITILLLCFPWAGMAQDSLKQDFRHLLEQAESMLFANPQQAAAYAGQARNSTDDPHGQVQALYFSALAERLMGNFDDSTLALFEAEELTAGNDRAMRGRLRNLMALNYCNLGDHNQAIAPRQRGHVPL